MKKCLEHIERDLVLSYCTQESEKERTLSFMEVEESISRTKCFEFIWYLQLFYLAQGKPTWYDRATRFKKIAFVEHVMSWWLWRSETLDKGVTRGALFSRWRPLHQRFHKLSIHLSARTKSPIRYLHDTLHTKQFHSSFCSGRIRRRPRFGSMSPPPRRNLCICMGKETPHSPNQYHGCELLYQPCYNQ